MCELICEIVLFFNNNFRYTHIFVFIPNLYVYSNNVVFCNCFTASMYSYPRSTVFQLNFICARNHDSYK